MSSAIEERGLMDEYGALSSPHAANANSATMAIGPSVARRRVNDFRPLDGPRRSILPPRTEILLPLSNRTKPVFARWASPPEQWSYRPLLRLADTRTSPQIMHASE